MYIYGIHHTYTYIVYIHHIYLQMKANALEHLTSQVYKTFQDSKNHIYETRIR